MGESVAFSASTQETDLQCRHDLDGRLLWVNAAAARALGRAPDELVRMSLRELLAPEVRVKFQPYLDTVRRDGVATGLMTLRTHAGEYRVWEYRCALREGASTPIVVGAARDVTERVLTARALRASEDRFTTAFHASPIAMAITTVDEGRYLEVNEAFERQMGYTRDEIVGCTSLELNVWPSPGDRAAMVATLERQKTLRDQNAQFRTKSGSLITTLYSAGLISLGGRSCVLAAIADITAQRQAEDALRESESKYRLLAETARCGIFIFRPDGAFCYVNPRVEAFTGYSSGELLAMSVWDLVHPDSAEVARMRAADRSRLEAGPVRFECKVATKSGDTRWIDFTATPTEYEGKPAILGTTFDITGSKRHEQEANERAAVLHTLIANSPFGILVGDKDHRVQFYNAAFQHMFRYSGEDLLGRDPDDLVSLPENEEAREISKRVLSGETVHTKVVRRRKDGSRVNVELHAIPLMVDNAFAGCFGIYQDITERVESETKLRALRDRLTRVQDEERAHVARELHDNIGQRLAVLACQLAEVQKTSRLRAPSVVDQLQASSKLLEEICADTHRLSHRLHPSQVALVGLTKALATYCADFGRQNGIQVDFKHEKVPDLPSTVTTCLYRVAQEALKNAEKHSGAHRVQVRLAATSDAVSLCVSDSGRGFSNGESESGPGLGLMSMAERVRSVGGELSVQSAINGGTRVEASIPLPRTSAFA
jgi:PAS domain S-box-containing protein